MTTKLWSIHLSDCRAAGARYLRSVHRRRKHPNSRQHCSLNSQDSPLAMQQVLCWWVTGLPLCALMAQTIPFFL